MIPFGFTCMTTIRRLKYQKLSLFIHPTISNLLFHTDSCKRCMNVKAGATDSQSEIVKLSHNVHGSDQQNRSPLFILHGLFGSKTNWNSIAKVFARDRKIVTVDLRNHGDSAHSKEMNFRVMCDDLLALIHDLGYSRVSLMGHSMGGKTCMLLAIKYPELVDKLVIVDVSPERSPASEEMRIILDSLLKLTFNHSMTLSAARKQADADLKKTLTDEGLRQFLVNNITRKGDRYVLKVNPEIIASNFDNLMDFPIPNPVLKFNGKTLFVGGAKSKYISDDNLPEIRRLFPNATVTMVPNAGHWVHAEQPRKFMDVLDVFLQEDAS